MCNVARVAEGRGYVVGACSSQVGVCRGGGGWGAGGGQRCGGTMGKLLCVCKMPYEAKQQLRSLVGVEVGAWCRHRKWLRRACAARCALKVGVEGVGSREAEMYERQTVGECMQYARGSQVREVW